MVLGVEVELGGGSGARGWRWRGVAVVVRGGELKLGGCGLHFIRGYRKNTMVSSL